jgi:cytochrome c oxidase assembly protein subunit 15
MTRSSLFTDKNRQFFTSSLRRSVAAAPAVGAVAEEVAAKAKSSFPKISDKAVAFWLLGSAASVFGIVIFGGLTRLTESGFVSPV